MDISFILLVSLLFLLAIYGIVYIRRRQRFQDVYKQYEKEMRQFFHKKVPDPFGEKSDYITLGDLYSESALTPKSLGNIMTSFGLGEIFLETAYDISSTSTALKDHGLLKIADAVDPNTSPTVRALMFRNAKESRIVDGKNVKISDPNHIPELVPNSSLDRLTQYVQSKNYNDETLAGYTGEWVVHDKLVEKGYDVIMPENNKEGYDLLVEKKFFEDNGLHFNPDPQTSLDFGKLQVKTTRGKTKIQEHLQKHGPESSDPIPVIAPDAQLAGFPPDFTVGFSNIEADYDQILALSTTDAMNILEGHFGEVVKSGMETPLMENITSNYFDTALPDMGIPYFSLLISAAVGSVRSYQLVTQGKMNVSGAIKENTINLGGVAVSGLAFSGVSSGLATLLGNEGGINQLGGEALASLSDGLDLGDLEDWAELAIVAYLSYKAVGIVRKAWRKLFDPLKPLKNAQTELRNALFDFIDVLEGYWEQILKNLGIQSVLIQTERSEKIRSLFEIEKANLRQLKKEGYLPSLHYYALEYANKRQEKIEHELEKNLRNNPLGIVWGFVQRSSAHLKTMTLLQAEEADIPKIIQQELMPVYHVSGNRRSEMVSSEWDRFRVTIKDTKASTDDKREAFLNLLKTEALAVYLALKPNEKIVFQDGHHKVKKSMAAIERRLKDIQVIVKKLRSEGKLQ